jgi:hypothetical protein
MLRGDEDLEEASQWGEGAGLGRAPVPVVYNPNIPVETFDFIFDDECHRSIYNLWLQVLEYFDAYIVGLTATPSKQTFGFFNQNLVMEYDREQAVVDGVTFTKSRLRSRRWARRSRRGTTWTSATALRGRFAGPGSTKISRTMPLHSTALLSPRTRLGRPE